MFYAYRQRVSESIKCASHTDILDVWMQWGDSSPLFLPCVRFRDLAVHTVIAATGGMAAVAAPVMGPVSVSNLSYYNLVQSRMAMVKYI